MADQVIEKHQVAGVDERQRGFSRLVEVEQGGALFRARLRYEATLVATGDHPGPKEVLPDLVRRLQALGYTQLRSRLNFRGDTYLGSQEPWIEYPDPEPQGPLGDGLWGWIRRLFTRSRTETH